MRSLWEERREMKREIHGRRLHGHRKSQVAASTRARVSSHRAPWLKIDGTLSFDHGRRSRDWRLFCRVVMLLKQSFAGCCSIYAPTRRKSTDVRDWRALGRRPANQSCSKALWRLRRLQGWERNRWWTYWLVSVWRSSSSPASIYIARIRSSLAEIRSGGPS